MAVTTTQDLKATVQAHGKVVVKYFAEWCGTCRMLAPKFKRLSEDNRFQSIKFVEVDAEKNAAAKAFLQEVNNTKIDNLPFIVTFKEQKLVQAQAASKEDAIVGMLQAMD